MNIDPQLNKLLIMLEDYYNMLERRIKQIPEDEEAIFLVECIKLVRSELYSIVEASGFLLETTEDKQVRKEAKENEIPMSLAKLLKSTGLKLSKRGGTSDDEGTNK
ncbi:MAG: hypothetical protein H8E55_19800 [Pelagibacterales bacterium]|nr:hypothetical protein [Pelagibacterales bacterium]